MLSSSKIPLNPNFFLLNCFIFKINIKIIYYHKPLKNNILSVYKRLIPLNLHLFNEIICLY